MKTITYTADRSDFFNDDFTMNKMETFVIQTDDPDYKPSTYQRVAEIYSALAGLKQSIGIQTQDIFNDTPLKQNPKLSRVKHTFDELAAAWRMESSLCGTLLEMATLPCYQRIIGLGRAAIPHILASLAKEPDHWFWALKAITGEDPVPPEERGNLQKMTQAWLIWGVRNGYEF